MRLIDDILSVRGDISPFLIHVTKSVPDTATAGDVLKNIISSGQLLSGNRGVSAAMYAIPFSDIDNDEQKKRFFNAVCFTEAPLSELHCFFEIDGRSSNYEPYGLVFLKDKLKRRGVSPVFYVNNYQDDKSVLLQQLCSCITANIQAAEAFLPLLSGMGFMFNPIQGSRPHDNEVSFYWEREWRHPYSLGPFHFDAGSVFVGLCPHEEIEDFEEEFENTFGHRISFIDPNRNLKFYSRELIDAADEANIPNTLLF